MEFGKLGFGLLRLPHIDPHDPNDVDLETTKQMVDLFLQRGFQYFDTAYIYYNGMSEEYETSSDGHFVHIDTREKKSFWYGQKEAYRSTFGGSTPANTTTGTTTVTNTTSTTYKTLSQGSSGEAVKTLQENLNTLGHSCGTADGTYGAKTANAVREFQKKHNLTRDGIAGPLTQAAIKSALAGSFNVGDTVVVVANLLNVRKGAGTNYAVKTTVKKNAVYTLSEVQNGWGKLQEISGWVSLQYCQKQ